MQKNNLIIILCVIVIAVVTYFLVMTQLVNRTGTEGDAVPVPVVTDERGPTLTQSLDLVPNGTVFGAALARSSVYADTATLRPLTLFIPVDAAFASFTPEQREAVLAPENYSLYARHMVPGAITVSGSEGAETQSLVTLDNTVLELSYVGDVLMVNGSKVLVSEITIADGVIYLIDSILQAPASI